MGIYEPKGINFARAVAALARSGSVGELAGAIARRLYGPGVADFIEENFQRSAVASATTISSTWGGAVASDIGWSFVEAVAERSIFGSLLRRKVPFNVNIGSLTSGPTSYWRKQGEPAPMTSGVADSTPLPPLNLVGLVALSRELVEHGARDSEGFILGELIRSTVAAMDGALLDPTNTGTADKVPASITSTVSPISATSDIDEDLAAIIEDFPGDFASAAWIAQPTVFAALHSIVHQGIGPAGGELMNMPAYASRHAPPFSLILADGDAVVYADDGVVVEMSSEASLQMNDAPSGAASHVSLWQSGLIAVHVARRLNWRMARPGVSMLDDITWANISA